MKKGNDWLRKANPRARVTEVHAAIGGTGSGHCWYTRLATLNVFDGADGEHSVEIEVLAEQPERKLIKKEIDTACEKYDGTWFQPCQIMLIGDIVRQTPATCLGKCAILQDVATSSEQQRLYGTRAEDAAL